MTEQDLPDDKNRQRKIIFAVAFLVIAAGLFYYNFWPASKPSADRAYFTVDDGKTWFEDDINNIPPYMHDGKEAVGIKIYKTQKSAPFAGFLTKFPPEAKADIERQGKQSSPPRPLSEIAFGGESPTRLLVKAPMKDSPWVSIQSAAAQDAMALTLPDSSELDTVLPMD